MTAWSLKNHHDTVVKSQPMGEITFILFEPIQFEVIWLGRLGNARDMAGVGKI